MKLPRKQIKGQNGKVLVIGGSKDYVGAPAFAAMAALRTGIDIVTVCAPEKVAWTINSFSPDILLVNASFLKTCDDQTLAEITKSKPGERETVVYDIHEIKNSPGALDKLSRLIERICLLKLGLMEVKWIQF